MRNRQNGYLETVANDAKERGQAFAELIRSARNARGWTQERVLEETRALDPAKVGISKSTYVRWEAGRAERPEPDQVRLLCRALGIDPRRAAIALGYLSEDDIRPAQDSSPAALPPAVQEVLDILVDPTVPREEKAQWIDYLKYLRDRRQSGNEHNRNAG